MNSFWKGVVSIFGFPPRNKRIPRTGWEEAFKKDGEQISKDWESVIGKWDENENKEEE